MLRADDLLRPTGNFRVDVLLDRIEPNLRAADRAIDLWVHFKSQIPSAALMTAVHHWSATALSPAQAEVWKVVDSAIAEYSSGIMVLSGPRGIAKSAGAARWAMNKPGKIIWLRAPEAGRIALTDSATWQAIHDRLVESRERVVIDDLGSFNTTHTVAVNRLGDLLCSLHEAGTSVCITTNFGRTAIEQVYDQTEGGSGRLIDRLTGHGSTFVDLWDVAEGAPSFREHEPTSEPSPAASKALALMKAAYTMRQTADVEQVLSLLSIDRSMFDRDLESQRFARARVLSLIAPLVANMEDVDERDDTATA